MIADNSFNHAQAQRESQLPHEDKVIGKCENCHSDVTEPHWEDGYGNLFCDEICAEQFYEIVERKRFNQ